MAAIKTICDTDVLIDYFDAHQQRHHTTRKILEDKIGLDNVVLSAITKMELVTGARNKTELNTINKKLSRCISSPINHRPNHTPRADFPPP